MHPCEVEAERGRLLFEYQKANSQPVHSKRMHVHELLCCLSCALCRAARVCLSTGVLQ